MLYSWNIIGHEKVMALLEQDILSGNISHAYLFAGPDNIGKFSVAKTLAQILECENNFCHTCPTCIQLKKGCHYDTVEIADDGNSIKIESIREIIGKLNLSAQSRYKVLLMENIERLTIEAANCLLKTLEEPPPKTIFLLTTSNIKRIPATLISRLRLLSFHLVPKTLIFESLKEKYPDMPEATLKKVISFALGKPGKAIRLIENQMLLEWYERIYNELEQFFQTTSYAKEFALIEEISKEDGKIDIFLDIFLHFTRNMLLRRLKSSPRHIADLMNLLKETQRTKAMMHNNVNTRLAMENLLLRIPT